MKNNIYFLNSHPVQYFAPLYKQLDKQPDMDLTVLYCSKHGLQGEKDLEFGANVQWDIPVLEGYKSVFLKNHARKPSIYGFANLMNLGIIPYLFKAQKGTLVVHGWGYLTHILAIVAGKLSGHKVCLRGETPAIHEEQRSARSRGFRKLIFGKMLFSFVDYFLFIGKENKRFYQQFGVAERKLVFVPYSVDNERFRNNFNKLDPQKNELKRQLGLPADKTIILFSGKYIDKKRPLDLLQAFHHCRGRQNACLVFMGDGELRPKIEEYIAEHNLKNVILTGFINQSKVPEYYASADIFVMCSQEGETWGLSTNEAMNFCLPLLLSNMTGSSSDLVSEGENGYVFETGNADELAEKLDFLLSKSPLQLAEMGRVSEEIIQGYSYDQIIDGLRSINKISPSRTEIPKTETV